MKFWPILLACVVCLCNGCTFSVLTYPLAPFLAPLVGTTNTISVPSYDDLVIGKEPVLKKLTIGVLANPNRSAWQSKVDGEYVDQRIDENKLLAEFLQDSGLFARVEMVNNVKNSGTDYVISCSADCIYTIELNSFIYTMNCLTLGIGFLLGVPYQESSGSYVLESVIYDTRDGKDDVIAGSLAENYRCWRYDNMYWRPGFYGYSALKPLFQQVLYDFIIRSGCLQE